MAAKRITALQRISLFECLTEKKLDYIAQRVVELHFKKGDFAVAFMERSK